MRRHPKSFEEALAEELRLRGAQERDLSQLGATREAAVARKAEAARRIEWARDMILRCPRSCGGKQSLAF